MKFLSLILVLIASLPVFGQAPVPEGDYIVVCRIDEMIDEGIAVIVERAVREGSDAKAIIFEIDTLGGRVDSALRISNSIISAACPTIAWVTGDGAISAGALISYSCDHIIMAAGKSIGASTPFMPGADVADQVQEKSMSFLRAQYRALGEENGHNPLLGEAMVDQEIELWGIDESGTWTILKVEEGRVVERAATPKDLHHTLTPPQSAAAIDPPNTSHVPNALYAYVAQTEQAPEDALRRALRELLGEPAPPVAPPDTEGENEEKPAVQTETLDRPADLPENAVLISRTGKLLTLTSKEAERFGLIPTTANSLDTVANYYGLAEMKRHTITPTWAEDLFRWLTSPLISGLLLMLGIGGLYVEIRTPGFGLPGLVGLTCLALFFGSYLVVGMADWVDVILVSCGVALVLVEIFLLPGFGFIGIGGIVLIMIGTYLALTRVTIPEFSWDFQRLEDAGKTVATGLMLFVVIAAVTWKLFPRTRLFRAIAHESALDNEAGWTVQMAEEKAMIGLRGMATSVLRPAGRVRINDRTYDVMTRGEFIEAGTPVRIVQVEGNRYVVEAAPTGEDNA